ncbi:hypothetical protein [Helicobacter anatolicus]|nr:hypothetical protein [Helicobacter anatolicus]
MSGGTLPLCPFAYFDFFLASRKIMKSCIKAEAKPMMAVKNSIF